MLHIILGILSLAVIIAISTIYNKRRNGNEIDYFEPEKKSCGSNGVCCGAHAVCEKHLPKVKKEIIYFDDEELDRFSGKDNESYSLEDIQEFKEIMSSIREDEINIWLKSLSQRKIELPKSLIA